MRTNPLISSARLSFTLVTIIIATMQVAVAQVPPPGTFTFTTQIQPATSPLPGNPGIPGLWNGCAPAAMAQPMFWTWNYLSNPAPTNSPTIYQDLWNDNPTSCAPVLLDRTIWGIHTNKHPLSATSTERDAALVAEAMDVVVANLRAGQNMRFATTPQMPPPGPGFKDIERMTIVAGGNVGINVTAPLDLLHISDATYAASPAIRLSTVTSNALGQLALARLAGEYSNFAQANDLILRTGYVSSGPFRSDLILTARNRDGSIRFGTVDETQGITSDVQRMVIQDNGNVGIGIPSTGSPQDPLHIYRPGLMTVLRIHSGGKYSQAGTPTNRIQFYSGGDDNVESEFRPAIIQSVDDGNFTGALEFYTNGTGENQRFGPSIQAMRLVNGSVGIGSVQPYSARLVVKGSDASATANTLNVIDGNDKSLLMVRNDGFVGIGTPAPHANETYPVPYKLGVNGLIKAKEVRVNLDNWVLPDYVFDDDYDLRSLEQLETEIDRLHHLPDMPTAAEVAANGLPLGEMEGKLLLKIEELTLYVIELNKKLKAMEARLAGEEQAR